MLFAAQNRQLDPDVLMSKGISFISTTEPKSTDSLTAQEKQLVSDAPLKRRQDFATGRWCARQALKKIGIPPTSISVGVHREPIWPKGITGSISHTEGYYCAAVSPVKSALGVDAEELKNSFTFNNVKTICTSHEYKRITSTQKKFINFTCHIVFSAKEAFYKSVHPITRKTIGFKDVEVEINWTNSSYEILLLKGLSGDLTSGRRFRGDYWMNQNVVITLIALD